MTHLKTDISWLHLSDFHIQADLGWSLDVVLDSLIKDLRFRYGRETAPDLLFLTGDIAYSGSSTEYIRAEGFVRELQDATSVPSERVFIVPGNHDIARGLEEDAFRGASVTLQNEVEIDKFLARPDRCRTIFRRQRAFRKFVNRVAPPDGGGYSATSFSHLKRTTVGPINVAVLLLDSSWLAEGGPADTANLLIGERQIIDTNITLDDVLSFAMVHHPFAWLREFEQVPIENLILDRAHVVLRGHVHAADLRAVEALERRLTVFTAGATFENRTSDNSYNWTTVDLATGIGTTTTYRYIHATKKWQPCAPVPWSLTKSIPPVAIDDALELLTKLGGRFTFYRAAMIAGHNTLAPRNINTKTVLLNLEIDLPTEPNEIGKLVKSLRNLFFWRSAFEGGEWLAEAQRLAAELETRLAEVASTSVDALNILERQEEECQHTAKALVANVSSPVFDHLYALAANREWEQILKVIQRWESADLLSKSECKRMDRIAIQALFETEQLIEATAKLTSLLESDTVESFDFFLAASCCYQTKDYKSANRYIRAALDRGIEKEEVRKLVFLIAGVTGDKELREMVL
jgi:hypothetical protein